jgi:hypothetical protein
VHQFDTHTHTRTHAHFAPPPPMYTTRTNSIPTEDLSCVQNLHGIRPTLEFIGGPTTALPSVRSKKKKKTNYVSFPAINPMHTIQHSTQYAHIDTVSYTHTHTHTHTHTKKHTHVHTIPIHTLQIHKQTHHTHIGTTHLVLKRDDHVDSIKVSLFGQRLDE